tara:strand:+ start:3306 stop:4568 length:1263 start_codon:yes stop_codon:yes gene_type:complete
MKTVLLLGVGRSTHTLIKYLIDYSKTANIQVLLADQTDNEFINNYVSRGECHYIRIDINDNESRRAQIEKSDLVISMLPPKFHVIVAQDCIKYSKNLITASYVSDEIQYLDNAAKKANILILNEIGLDPGIDHISAMDIIDSLKSQGAVINTFKSFCGGLVAPEYDNNPWNYKFTWNPRNVVLAGSSGASYLKDGSIKTFSYKEVFSNTEKITIPNYGEFESYANRDSLHYRDKYNLLDAHTIVRGTLRRIGFSEAWDVFVKLGMTDSDPDKSIISKDDFFKYVQQLDKPHILDKMKYLDLFSNYDELNKSVSPADYLLDVLTTKWSLDKSDKDMIVMQHKFNYHINNKNHDLKLSMVVKGDDNIQTAMAKTVGLPVFFACKLLLENKITLKGVKIPIYQEIYKPILKSLSSEGIDFVTS